jgi:hypothetical protein
MTRTRLTLDNGFGRLASVAALLAILAVPILARADRLQPKTSRPERSIWVQLVPAPGWQKGCPLQVAAIVPRDGNLVGYVAVINRSYEPVKGFSLGVVATDLGAAKPLGVYRTFDVREEVPPRGMLSLQPHLGSLVEAAAFAHQRGAASVGFTTTIARTPGFAAALDQTRLDAPGETEVLDDPFDELEPRIQADIEAYLSESADEPLKPASADTTSVVAHDGGGPAPTSSVHCVAPNPNEPAGSGQCSVALTTTGGTTTANCTITQCPRWPRPCNRLVCGNAVILTP